MPAPAKPVANPISAGTLKLSPYQSSGSMSQLMGTKTKVPGGVNTPVANTTNQPAPASQQQAVGTPQTPAPTFQGAVGNLLKASQTGSPVAGTAASQLVNTQPGTSTAQGYTLATGGYGAGNIPIGQQAADIAAQYGKQIANIGTQGAAFGAGQRTTGTSPVAEGNAAVTAQTTAQQQQALAAGESAALQGTGQELTAQQQAANAANAAAGTALTGQSNQITGQNAAGNLGIAGQGQLQTGLTSAAGLAQPQLGSIGQVPFSPLTQDQGAVLGSTQPGGVAVAGNLLGQLQGAQAAGAAPGQTQASNIQTLGTAGTTGEAAVLQSLPALQAANTAAQGIQSTISSFLSQNPDINPTNIALATAAQQWLGGKQITDPRYQTLFNYLNEYTNTLAPVLGVGGSPTNLKTEIAQSFINPQAGATSISQVMQNMSQLASDKVKNFQSGASGGGTVAGGTSPGTPAPSGTIQTSYGTINPNL